MVRVIAAAGVLAAMLVGAQAAQAGSVLEVRDGHARLVRDPLLPAAKRTALPAAGRRVATLRLPVVRAAAALPPEVAAALADARSARDALPPGAARGELAGVIANVEALDASGQLTPSRVPATHLVEVERRADCFAERGLLAIEQTADLLAERGLGDRGDVVAGRDGGGREPVCHVEGHFRRESSDGCRDGRDRDGAQMRAHELAREHERRSRLIESRDVDRAHQSSEAACPRACSARPSSSGSGPARAKIGITCRDHAPALSLKRPRNDRGATSLGPRFDDLVHERDELVR